MHNGNFAASGHVTNETMIPSTLRSLLILGFAMSGISFIIYGVMQLPRLHYGEINVAQFKSRDFREGAPNPRNVIASSLGLDTLNHKGVSGKFSYDSASGAISMHIRDRDGNPVPGIHVTATLRRPNGRTWHKLVMHQDATRRYTAPVRRFGTGDWRVTVSASDPHRTHGTNLMFQIDKDLRVKRSIQR